MASSCPRSGTIPERARNVNQDQFLSVVRSLLSIAGTLGVAYGVGTENTWATIGSSVIPIAALAWGQFVHSDSQKVASVSAMPEVKGLTVTDSKLADAAKAADPTTAVTVTKG